MDDILVISDALEEIVVVKQTLHKFCSRSNIWERPGTFLAWKILEVMQGLKLHRKYALDLLQDTSLFYLANLWQLL